MADYTSFSDLQLVDLIQAGNPRAFNEIFDRYSPILITFSYKKLGDREVAQDMLQSIFADLWEKRSSLNISGEFRTYIFTVLKNRIFDHYKHAKVSQRYLDHFQNFISNVEDSTDHMVRYNDLALLIEREIAALPEGMRVVFNLSRNTSLTRKEIAAQLNLSEEGVKTRMHRALTILKKRLGVVLLLV